MKVLGHDVELTEEMDCSRGGDHRALIRDARVDCLNRGFSPDERYALCGRCAMAVSLKI